VGLIAYKDSCTCYDLTLYNFKKFCRINKLSSNKKFNCKMIKEKRKAYLLGKQQMWERLGSNYQKGHKRPGSLKTK
jgi:hypothetical protein